MFPKQQRQTIRTLVGQLLDKSYNAAASVVVAAINGVTNNPRIQGVLALISQLAGTGEQLTPDVPAVRLLRAELMDQLGAIRPLLNNAAGNLQNSGLQAGSTLARQLSLPGFTDDALAKIGVAWKTPDPEAVARLIDYATSDAWLNELKRFSKNVTDDALGVVTRGMINGWNPSKTARALSDAVEGMPLHRAANLMRTLQLTSSRKALTSYHMANADIFSHKIRVATLDGRTCMSCIALHGTTLKLDEDIADHHGGRCTAIAVIKGVPRTIQTGEDWFNKLTPERQRQQMGGAAFAAWKDDAVRLKDFVHPYDDAVFGPMVRESSLKGILGDQAKNYYRR